MHPVEEGQPFLFRLMRHDLVGEKHEGLDQAVALQPLNPENRDRLSLVTQQHAGLRKVEVQGATILPFLTQDFGKRRQGEKGLVRLRIDRLFIVQDGLRLFVTQLMAASDLSTLEPGLSDAARRVHRCEYRHREAIRFREQRAGVG